MKLTDVPKYGHLAPPGVWPFPPEPQPTGEPCPECPTGRVVQVSDNPTAVRYRCTRCGWDA